jgi:hypothetical protein
MCLCHRERALAVYAVALLAFLFGGCRAGATIFVNGTYQPIPTEGVHFGKFEQTPKPRMGGLPWPGPFTLFALADPNHLGHHAYDFQSGAPEADRGILYTTRGGFIDIAHARKTIDLCKYVAVRAEFALLNDWNAFQVKSLEPSTYVVHLEYPAFWTSLPPAEKKTLAHELSIRIGQRMAMLIVTWHETLTWFGYQSTPIISEWPSAFTWDDTGAHAFGVMVGGRALHDSRDWDDAVTDAINVALKELGVVSPQECANAIDRVKGIWWSDSGPLKRQIELGWNGETLDAWLVPDGSRGRGAAPHRYILPQLDNVLGHNCSGLLHIVLSPNVFETNSIRAVIPGKPERVDVDRDLPLILEHMRQWHAAHEGPQALKPQ